MSRILETDVEWTGPVVSDIDNARRIGLMHDVRGDGRLPVTLNGREVGTIRAKIADVRIDVATWGVISGSQSGDKLTLVLAPFPADSCGCLRDFEGHRRRTCREHGTAHDGTMHNQIAEDDGYPDVVRDWGRM